MKTEQLLFKYQNSNLLPCHLPPPVLTDGQINKDLVETLLSRLRNFLHFHLSVSDSFDTDIAGGIVNSHKVVRKTQ